jgi:hypothetical protein
MKRLWWWWDGFSKIDLTAVLLGLVVFGAGVGVLELFLRTYWFRAIPESILMTSNYDQFTHTAWQVKRIKSDSRNNIYFVAGSSGRECILDMESVESALGNRFPLFFLSDSQQSFGEVMAIVDSLPANSGRIVIGINPTRFSRELKDYEDQLRGKILLLQSPTLIAFMKHQEAIPFSFHFLLPGWLMYAKRYFNINKNSITHLTIPLREYNSHFYDSPVLSYDQKVSLFDKYVKPLLTKRFYKNLNLNLDALQVVVHAARAKGLEVAFIEMPVDPAAQETLNDIIQTYQKNIRRLALRDRVPYFPFARNSFFVSGDFYDFFHLAPPGQEKFQTVFTTMLKKYLQIDNS